MDTKKINQAAARLESWAKTLVNHLNSETSNYSELRDVLNGKKPSSGKASKEQIADICLREVEQDIEEISGAFEDLQSAIFDKNTDK